MFSNVGITFLVVLYIIAGEFNLHITTTMNVKEGGAWGRSRDDNECLRLVIKGDWFSIDFLLALWFEKMKRWEGVQGLAKSLKIPRNSVSQ
jgi:hypothetical protein